MSTITRVYYDLVARDSASRTFRDVGDSATFAEGRIGKLAKSFALAGTVVGTAAVVVAVESTRMATQFQTAMTKVQTQAGASARDVKVLSSAVLGLAERHAQQAPIDLANSLYHLKSVGLDNVAAMKALKASSDLAAVGGADLEETTNAIAGAWRSGIKGAQNFGAAAAAVNAIIGAGNMRMGDFIDAIGTGILPAARTFGVSLTSVGSALALMTDEGIPASDAATRLRMTLSLMGAPSDKAVKALGSIGLSSTSLATAMRSPRGITAAVELLKQHLDDSGLSAVQSAAVISHAFGGGRSSSAIMTLLNNVDVLRRKQDQVNASMGKFGPAVEAQSKTAAAQFARLRTEVDAIGIQIGSALLPPVTRFAGFLASTVVPGAVTAAHKVSSVFHDLVPVDAIRRDWDKVVAFFGMGPKPKPLTGVDLIHPSANLAPSPAGPGLSSTHLDTFYGGLAKVKPPPSLGASLGKALGTALGNAITGLASHAGQFGKLIVNVLGSLDWTNIGKMVGGNAAGFALGFLSNLGADLFSPKFWEQHWFDVILGVVAVIPFGGKLAGILGRILEHVPVLKAFAPMLKGLESLTGPMRKGGLKLLRSIGGGILDGIDHVLPGAGGAVGRWVIDLAGRILGYGVRMQFAGTRLIRGLGDGILSMARLVGRVIGMAIGWLIKPFAGAGRWLLDTGGHLITGLLDGIRAKMAGIGAWVKGAVVDPIVGWVKHFFGIKSPSTVFHGIGFQLIAGLVRGMMSHDIGGFVTSLFGSMPKALGHIVGKGLVSLEHLPKSALKVLGKLGGMFDGLLGKIFGGGGATTSGGAVSLGERMAAAMGWGSGQFADLNKLWTKESGWNYRATNPSSGAYGIPQALPASKMASAGADWLTNPATQIRWGLGYIKERYGSPAAAWAHEVANNWYAAGTKAARAGLAVVGERGPELINLRGGEQILDAVSTSRAVQGFASGSSTARSIMLSLEKASTNATIWADIRRFLKAINEHFNGSHQRWRDKTITDQGRRMAELATRAKDISKNIANAKAFASNTKGTLKDYAAISGLDTTGSYTTGKGGNLVKLSGAASVEGQLKGKLTSIKQFGTVIRKLSAAGAPASLIRTVVGLGVDQGTQFGQALLSDKKSMRAIAGTEAEIGKVSGQIGRGAAGAVYGGKYDTGKNFVGSLEHDKARLERLMRDLGKTLGQEAGKWLGVPARRGKHKKMAQGGWLMNPVWGHDSAGNTYELAENGPEYVGGRGRGGRGPAVVIQEAHFHDETDLNLLMQKIDFAVVSGGLGG